MIVFNHIKFKNWIPYYGDQKLEFSTKSDKNITIVVADSQTGKTSISRGILWCMFGTTNDKRNRYKTDLERLNQKVFRFFQ